MSKIGDVERITQNRVVKLFQEKLGYTYYGDWQVRENNRNIEEAHLTNWLKQRGTSPTLIDKALRELSKAAAIGEGKNLYDANKAVYSLLRYGVKVREGAGELTQTVWLIDWKNPDANLFAIAEEVSVKGENKKRPDIVLYVNGIALGVIELKRAKVSIGDGIRQNLDNQKKSFIRNFYSTMQLVMAGNDTQGLRYGTIETREKYYLEWREENPAFRPDVDDRGLRYLPASPCPQADNPLDCAILRQLNKPRFLELIHDFIVFDEGVKKVPRHNQYFGIKAAQAFIDQREGGIIWHTQGSGKSLTMVWLAKWVKENVTDSRILIITDRTELDKQIEGVFIGVDEQIYRSSSGADLIRELDRPDKRLLCSLVHKFGHKAGQDDDETDEKVSKRAADEYVAELKKNLPTNFSPKGNLFVFVDECHRTQSGKLHTAMKAILPDALFIGFTGTPLLKQDKQKSIEIFGRYIHTYKFDQAVKDGVVLDLRYEARDIDQYIRSAKDIDEWFELNTKGMTDIAKLQLKLRWGTMRKVLSSKSRLEIIVQDIWKDMKRIPRLAEGGGNAMLVCSSIYQACKVYEMFQVTDLVGKCAIITSYKPSSGGPKGEESGAGLTEKLNQYNIYRRMLADFFDISEDEAIKRVEEFETKVKARFKDEPGQMKLLIVVDKLLTGFDAPSATYLYIDKQMRDHGLFQAICRVNRLDGEDKEYGYIVDYKDLFHSLEGAISDYTSGALDGYDQDDVAGLLTDRLGKGAERIDETRETVLALCEEVRQPKAQLDYFRYFSAADHSDKEQIKENESKRVALYKAVAAYLRAYANIANELPEAGYTSADIDKIRAEVGFYQNLVEEIKQHSGDYLDMKQYEPAMRNLIDMYIQADSSEKLSDFEDLGLIELIVEMGLGEIPQGIKSNQEAMAETIENNIRKLIIDERPNNPKYYDEMSELLEALIEERRNNAIEYQEYLEAVKKRFKETKTGNREENRIVYPDIIETASQRALYENLGKNADLAYRVDQTILNTKKDNWKGSRLKERQLRGEVKKALGDQVEYLDEIWGLIESRDEYQ